MKLFLIALLAFTHATYSEAQELLSTENVLVALKFKADSSCSVAKLMLDKPSNKSDLYAGQQMAKMACECMPQQIQKVRALVSSGKIAANINEAEFDQTIKPIVLEKCAADQTREVFGTGCEQRFEKEVSANPKYCKCMFDQFSLLSDKDIATMAASAYTDYRARVDARAKGLPDPPKSEASQKRADIEQSCK
jgi:hypothetical protein